MPGTGVYFVNSASSAWCAATLMASGVPKSGSPAPKSITSTPARRSLSTVAVTAIVAELAIREVRSANRAMPLPSAVRRSVFYVSRSTSDPRGLLVPQASFHHVRHEPVYSPAEREHLLDQPRA